MISSAHALVVAASFAVSVTLIVMLRPWLQRHALARPNARSSHQVPTPQGGGIAVVAATIGVAGAATLLWPHPSFDPTALGIVFIATTIVALVGAVDDFRTLGIATRLSLQTLAVLLVLSVLPADVRIMSFLPWWIECALLLVACLWFVNLVNFMDGIDWMTAAEVVPVTAALAVLGWVGALPHQAVVVTLALGGAMLGFAPFNRPVARLFLGDVGSLPIGLLLAWLLLLLAASGHLAAALLLPLYYVADATITLLRRICRRERFWQAHRSHFYQQALDRGFSVRQVVSRVFAVNVVLGALATATVLAPSAAVAWAAVMAGIALITWLLVSLRGMSSAKSGGPGLSP